jgi:hypothetical protein
VVCTFSNRCFPTKAIRGWLSFNENARCELVARYLKLAGFTDVTIALRTPPNTYGDPLYAVTGRSQLASPWCSLSGGLLYPRDLLGSGD